MPNKEQSPPVKSADDAKFERLLRLLGDPITASAGVRILATMPSNEGVPPEYSERLRAALRDAQAGARDDDQRESINHLIARLPELEARGRERHARAWPGAPNVHPIQSGFEVAPPYKEAHHIVVDHVPDSGTRWRDVYLFACGRYFSGLWVRRNGGLRSPDGALICSACLKALERGA